MTSDIEVLSVIQDWLTNNVEEIEADLEDFIDEFVVPFSLPMSPYTVQCVHNLVSKFVGEVLEARIQYHTNAQAEPVMHRTTFGDDRSSADVEALPPDPNMDDRVDAMAAGMRANFNVLGRNLTTTTPGPITGMRANLLIMDDVMARPDDDDGAGTPESLSMRTPPQYITDSLAANTAGSGMWDPLRQAWRQAPPWNSWAQAISNGPGDGDPTRYGWASSPNFIRADAGMDVQRRLQERMALITAQRERILEAFVAQHGYLPDQAEQVLMSMPDGSTTWRVQRRQGVQDFAQAAPHMAAYLVEELRSRPVWVQILSYITDNFQRRYELSGDQVYQLADHCTYNLRPDPRWEDQIDQMASIRLDRLGIYPGWLTVPQEPPSTETPPWASRVRDNWPRDFLASMEQRGPYVPPALNAEQRLAMQERMADQLAAGLPPLPPRPTALEDAQARFLQDLQTFNEPPGLSMEEILGDEAEPAPGLEEEAS